MHACTCVMERRAASPLRHCGRPLKGTSLLRQGWQGAHTLPREVQLDAESASLLMNPVEEVARLRQKQLYSNSSLQLPSNSSSGALKVSILPPLCTFLAGAWPVQSGCPDGEPALVP